MDNPPNLRPDVPFDMGVRDTSPTLDGSWHSPTLVQAILADSMRLALVQSGLWAVTETERAREFTVQTVGLPWRGSWTVTIQPDGDHRAEIAEIAVESHGEGCQHPIVQTPLENLGFEVTPDTAILKCCTAGCDARWRTHDLPGAIVADLQRFGGINAVTIAIESDTNFIVERNS